MGEAVIPFGILIWLAGTGWGIAGLMARRFAPGKSRFNAVVLIAGMLVFLGLLAESTPWSEGKPVEGATFLLSFIALLLIGAAVVARRAKLVSSPEKVDTISPGVAAMITPAKSKARQMPRAAPEPSAPLTVTIELDGVRQAIGGKKVVPPVPPTRKAAVPHRERSSAPVARDRSSGWSAYIKYIDAQSRMSERRIICRRIEGQGQKMSVHALCCEKNAPRRFLVHRIIELVDAETGELLDPLDHFTALARQGAVPAAEGSMRDFATVLMFVARCDGSFAFKERWAVRQALHDHIDIFGGGKDDLEDAYAAAFRLAPDDIDFLDALKSIAAHPRAAELAELTVMHIGVIAEADGQTDATERHWIRAVNRALKAVAA